MNQSKAKKVLKQRFWKAERPPKTTKQYIPLEEREDQSWRNKVIVLGFGQK